MNTHTYTSITRSSIQLLVALLLLIPTLPLTAQDRHITPDVPATISYQGLVTTTNGDALHDGAYAILVTLYGDSEGNKVIWQESYTTTINDGLFHLYLGSGQKALPGPSVMNRPLWVGTRIEGHEEMRPLTPLTSSPYALNVSDMAITAEKLAAGAVTAEKVDMDYISEVEIDGKKVSGKGAVLKLESGEDINLNYDEITGSVKIERANAVTGTHKGEKDPTVQASPDAWNSEGDITDGTTVTPAVATDWLGTGDDVTFTIKVDNQTIMRYQPDGGGASNTPNVLGGNSVNSISASSIGSVIGGGGATGNANEIDANYSVIGGGANNEILSLYATIAGGEDNIVQGNGEHAVISGGLDNSVDGNYAVVGGGLENLVRAYCGASLGGDNLTTTTSYAQTAVGFVNAPRGTVGVRPLSGALTDDPLFMVGNGEISASGISESNAFEVSYNGHTVVYHNNRSGGASGGPAHSVIRGATYIDNIVYAWADVPSAAAIAPGGMVAANSDFGVFRIQKVAAGIYDVQLNIVHPATGNFVALSDASITATIAEPPGILSPNTCAIITTSRMGPANTFRVYTRTVNSGCTLQDYPFMFKVTGRP